MIHLMKRKYLKIALFLLVFYALIIQFPLSIRAVPECDYGSCDAWMSVDGKTWMNTTIDTISLSCGQPFFIKVMMKVKEDHTWLALYLSEVGTRSEDHCSFKVIDGPCDLNDGYDLGKCLSNETKIVIWKLKVKNDPLWVNGYTPISINAFFQKRVNDQWETEDISFSIALIHLNEDRYSPVEEHNYENESLTTEETSDLSIISILFLLLITRSILFFVRKH